MTRDQKDRNRSPGWSYVFVAVRDHSRLARDRAALFISHCLAAVGDANRILALRVSRLVEGGTRAKLWRLQVERCGP